MAAIIVQEKSKWNLHQFACSKISFHAKFNVDLLIKIEDLVPYSVNIGAPVTIIDNLIRINRKMPSN